MKIEMTRLAPWGVMLALAAGCGGSTASEPEGVAAVEQAVSTCTGPSGAFCRFVTPAEAGTPGSGSYPDAHVVIRPASPTKPELIVFLPGTLLAGSLALSLGTGSRSGGAGCSFRSPAAGVMPVHADETASRPS